MIINPAQLVSDTQKHREFLEKYAQAYARLKDLEEFQFLERLERDQVEDLKTHATTVNINDPHYERKTTYLTGMANGLRRWVEQKKKYLDDHKRLKEGELQNARTNSPAHRPRPGNNRAS